MKLMGMVTLYHPNQNIIKNIKSYINDVDYLLVIDNTESPIPNLSDWFSPWRDKIEYVPLGDNKGIAYAINYAIKRAAGYDFLLTMDQDSSFYSGMIKKYRSMIDEFQSDSSLKVGMYTINYDQSNDSVEPGWRLIEKGITSGSILPISTVIELGGFDENLFIDEVDNEYCYRIRKNGYNIIEFPSILLSHSIGSRQYYRLGGYTFSAFNHNAMRKYYITRNKIYIMKKYPEIRKEYISELIKMTFKVFLVEQDKLKKIKSIACGCRDGLLNRMGKRRTY